MRRAGGVIGRAARRSGLISLTWERRWNRMPEPLERHSARRVGYVVLASKLRRRFFPLLAFRFGMGECKSKSHMSIAAGKS